MSGKYGRIGISGGTFDPVHYGHLIATEDIREKFGLDKVVFIPTGMPPHKKDIKVTGAEHRYKMLCTAVETNPYFEVSRIELDRVGYTYTVDTLTQLKSIYGDETELFFITGADVVFDLLTWREYRRVFSLCDFIAALRPGFKKEGFINAVDNLKAEYGARIHTAEVPQIEISSTAVRDRVMNNKSIKYLVPESVERYITENKLYRDSD